ncbi:fluoride efflux transporter CrcB [Mycobacterium adipatum]
MNTALVWAAVMVLGGLGAVCRLLVDRTVSGRVKLANGLPVGTLAVNVSGAWLLGLLGALALTPQIALLAGTAFVGAYTTFSTWMLETQRLAEERQGAAAAANIVVSMVAGVAAAWLGQLTGRAL